MPFATNLIRDLSFNSVVSTSGTTFYATYKFFITHTFQNGDEPFTDVSASQYLLIGDGKYSHPNEKIVLNNNENEVIVSLIPRSSYTLKLVQKTNDTTFYSNTVFITTIEPFEGTILNIDPFDQAFRIKVSYNSHDMLHYAEYGIPITHVTFILSYKDNGGGIFDIEKEVSMNTVNGTQQMQTQFIISNLDFPQYHIDNDVGIQNGFTYDINFYATNEVGPGRVSEAYLPIQPIDLPDTAIVRIGDQTLNSVDYFDTRMTFTVMPPLDFSMYNTIYDLSAIHLRATTPQWTKIIILSEYNDISSIDGFIYTWIDPSFVNGSTIKFAASYESRTGRGGITDTVFAYDDRKRWSSDIDAIPFGKPIGPTFGEIIQSLDQITYTWISSNDLNGTLTTDPILYDISLIYANTGLYVPNEYHFDLSANTKTFIGLLSGRYQAIVIQHNVNPNDNSVIVSSIPTMSEIIQIGFVSPIISAPTYHFVLTDDSGRGEVTLNWEAPSTNDFEILQYHALIYGEVSGIDFSANRIVDVTNTSVRFTGIPNNHNLNVELYASNSIGNSEKTTQMIRINVPPKKLRPENIDLIQGNQEITLEILASYVDDSLLSPRFFIVSYRRQNSLEPYSDEIKIEITNETNIVINGLANGYNYDFKCNIEGNTGNRNHHVTVSQYPIDIMTSGTTLFNVTRSLDGDTLLFVF